MSLYRRNGQTLNPDASFVGVDDVQHLAGWLRTASPEELAAEGITVMDPQPRPDDRLFIVTDNGDGTFTTTPRDIAPVIAAAREARIALCWSVMTTKLQVDSVSVTTSAGSHAYGMDDGSRDNIDKALMGVALNITPNPRPWTPKGATSPILLTHDDIKDIGRQIGARYDAFIQVYLTKKANIKATVGANDRATLAAIESYDATGGWPT